MSSDYCVNFRLYLFDRFHVAILPDAQIKAADDPARLLCAVDDLENEPGTKSQNKLWETREMNFIYHLLSITIDKKPIKFFMLIAGKVCASKSRNSTSFFRLLVMSVEMLICDCNFCIMLAEQGKKTKSIEVDVESSGKKWRNAITSMFRNVNSLSSKIAVSVQMLLMHNTLFPVQLYLLPEGAEITFGSICFLTIIIKTEIEWESEEKKITQNTEKIGKRWMKKKTRTLKRFLYFYVQNVYYAMIKRKSRGKEAAAQQMI